MRGCLLALPPPTSQEVGESHGKEGAVVPVKDPAPVQANMWRQVLDGGEGTWWLEGGSWAGRWEVVPQNKPLMMGTS